MTNLEVYDRNTKEINIFQFVGQLEFCLQEKDIFIVKHSFFEGVEYIRVQDNNIYKLFDNKKDKEYKIDFYFSPCESIHYSSKNSKYMLVYFHGGPESYEFNTNEKQYLYSYCLTKDIDVLVINYIGSTYSFKNHLSNKNWIGVIQNIIETIDFFREKIDIDYDNILFYGSSFGTILSMAVIDSMNKSIHSLIQVAPVIDLKNHMLKVDNEELIWFKNKFSNYEIGNLFSKKVWMKDFEFPIFVIQSVYDEVLDFKYTN